MKKLTALIACMPPFAGLLNVEQEFAQFFGGTSLMILVGVVLVGHFFHGRADLAENHRLVADEFVEVATSQSLYYGCHVVAWPHTWTFWDDHSLIVKKVI